MLPGRRPIFRQAALDRLASPEQLDEFLNVVSPRAWMALAALGTLLAGLCAWSLFGRISVEVSGEGRFSTASPLEARDTLAIIYLGASDAGRVRPGMAVRVQPLTNADGNDATLAGTVESVDGFPAPRRELELAFADTARVERLAAATAVRVTVTVPSSRIRGPAACGARIAVGAERPVAFVLPGIGR